ncbi:MAG TPA: response regulator [Leptolyngbyaceae cyanobacterium M65_K2018_010]|nr:response regulator [Leptolyngbyaceae cyanobacterium M65_K2018_010]
MSQRSILLIEYEANLREILGDCLIELGHWQVTPSSSIQEGVELCSKSRPDVILMDSSSPEIDVLIYAEKLKRYAKKQSVPIILISTKANWFTLKELNQMGFAGAINKPFNPCDLSSQVTRLANVDT